MDAAVATGQPATAGLVAAKQAVGRPLQTAGFDVSPDIVGMIQKGDLDFTMDQQGWWRGYISVLELVHYIRYGLIQSNYFLTGPQIVDKTNADAVAGTCRGGSSMTLASADALLESVVATGISMTTANTTGQARSAASRGLRRRAVDLLRRLLQRPELASLGGLVAAFVVFSILRPDLFLTHDNGVNVASLAAQYGIVAVGVTLLMIAGHFDLSVGTIVGLTGWAMYYFGNVLGLPPVVTILWHARVWRRCSGRSTASSRCAPGCLRSSSRWRPRWFIAAS